MATRTKKQSKSISDEDKARQEDERLDAIKVPMERVTGERLVAVPSGGASKEDEPTEGESSESGDSDNSEE